MGTSVSLGWLYSTDDDTSRLHTGPHTSTLPIGLRSCLQSKAGDICFATSTRICLMCFYWLKHLQFPANKRDAVAMVSARLSHADKLIRHIFVHLFQALDLRVSLTALKSASPSPSSIACKIKVAR